MPVPQYSTSLPVTVTDLESKKYIFYCGFIFFSLIISITEHLFYLLAINVSIFFKFLFNSLAYFSIGLKHSDFKNSFWGGIKWIPCQQHPKTINKDKLINQTGSKLKGKQKTERQAIQGKKKKHFFKKKLVLIEKKGDKTACTCKWTILQ